MHRRAFLQLASTAALTAQSLPGEGIRLGFDSYTIRGLRWKALQLLDYAAGLKLDTIQLSSLNDYESLEPDYLRKVKDHAARLGISVDAGMGCICPTTKSWNPKEGDPAQYLLKGLRTAQAVGATAMRCFIGSPADRRGPLPVEAHIESTLKVLRSVRAQALDSGVKIAIENHGDLEAREVKTLIEAAGKDFVASCLDIGNPMWLLEDPVLTVEVLGPYVVTTHIRDSAVYEHPRGAAFQWVALGDGSVDLPALLAVYRRVCPHAAMQLEIITGRPPQILPYLEPEYWKAFPAKPAADFARFMALVKRGRPFIGQMMIGGEGKQPPAFEAALIEQQRVDLERSLEYAEKALGAGIRWKT